MYFRRMTKSTDSIVTLEDVISTEIVGQEIVGEFDPAVDMQERARQEGHPLLTCTDSAPE